MKTRAFVGREREFSELRRRLALAAAGECQLVLVAGPQGTGKGRLLEELGKIADDENFLILQDRFPEQEAFPYQPFCNLIQEYFVKRQQLQMPAPDFSDLAGDLFALFPALREVEDLRAAAAAAESEGVEKRFHDRASIFELLARTLLRIGNDRPLALFLTDVHRATASLDALLYIVRRMGPTRTLIVCTSLSPKASRQNPVIRLLDSFQGDQRFTVVRVYGFLPSEHRAYVMGLLQTAEIDEVLADRIYDLTEGNPFLTTELVRTLVAENTIVQTPAGGWKFREGAGADTPLPTLQDTVKKRMARLSRNARRVLQSAAALGRLFTVNDLQLIVESPATVDKGISELIEAGFIDELRDRRFLFRSSITMDLVYSSLPAARKKSLHLRYAEKLEKENAESPDRVYSQLARHYALAGVHEKVVDYGMMLAMRSLDAFSAEEAIRGANAVLDSVEKQPDETRLLEAEARVLLAASCKMARRVDAAITQLEKAIAIYESQQQDFQVLRATLMAAEAAWDARRPEETERWVGKGIAAARAGNETWSLEKFLSLGATVANMRGDYHAAREYSAEAERIRSTQKTGEEQFPSGGKVTAALLIPWRIEYPEEVRLVEEEELMGNVYESLTTADANGNIRPNLCERWEALDGGKSFLFTLQPDVWMHDGKPLTATDVKKSFENAILRTAQRLPAALEAISGVADFIGRNGGDLASISALSRSTLRIDLQEALPIYPVLVSDTRVGILRESTDQDGRKRLAGTGPFRMTSCESNRVTLSRNADYRGDKPRIDEAEFRCGLPVDQMASELRSGRVDIGRDLRPEDLENFLREKDRGWQIVEVPRLNVYLALFTRNGTAGSNPQLRQAMLGILRTEDLVFAALGRFAKPATNFLPPGTLGHDPDRRRHPLLHEKAEELIEACGLPRPIRLRACAHPLYSGKLSALTKGMFKAWRELGIEVTIETPDMDSFIKTQIDSTGMDIVFFRWNADYPDPDNFTYGLFNSRIGVYRSYFCTPETDRLLEEARAQQDTRQRERLYRKFQNMMIDEAFMLPLFHDIDYRLATPAIRGLILGQHPPFVNYRDLAKTTTA